MQVLDIRIEQDSIAGRPLFRCFDRNDNLTESFISLKGAITWAEKPCERCRCVGNMCLTCKYN